MQFTSLQRLLSGAELNIHMTPSIGCIAALTIGYREEENFSPMNYTCIGLI